MQPIDLEANETAQEIEKLMSNLPTVAAEIESDEKYQEQAQILMQAKDLANRADAARKKITKPLYAEQKRVNAWFKDKFENPLQTMVNNISAAIKRYDDHVEALRQEAIRKAQAEADRERERKEKLAQKALERGDTAKAEEHQAAADTAVADVPEISTPQVSGLSRRENWQFEVTDERLIPRQFLMVDEQKIRKVVKAMKKDAQETIPGIRVYDAGTLVAKSA